MREGLPVLIILCTLGVALVIAHFLLRRSRRYLLYLGFSFITFGVYPVMSWSYLRLACVLVSVVFVILAAWQAYEDTQDRLADFYKHQREREEAFSEYVQELTRLQSAKTPPKDEQ